jgi:hypothetical protein
VPQIIANLPHLPHFAAIHRILLLNCQSFLQRATILTLKLFHGTTNYCQFAAISHSLPQFNVICRILLHFAAIRCYIAAFFGGARDCCPLLLPVENIVDQIGGQPFHVGPSPPQKTTFLVSSSTGIAMPVLVLACLYRY